MINQNDPRLAVLARIQSDLFDKYLIEADPKHWPSLDTPQGRGDCLYLKKNAAMTAMLLLRTHELRFLRVAEGSNGRVEEQELTAETRAAEEEARRLISNVLAFGKKGKS